MRARLRNRTERGAVVVEAAFVLPILMLLILGLVDLAMWNFQKSQASSAARDGARAAMYSATSVDVSGNAANARVHDAIAARLGNQSFTFTVTCMTSTTTTPKSCTVDATTVDRDRVQVAVTWTRPAMTFVSKWFGSSSTITASARMTIIN